MLLRACIVVAALALPAVGYAQERALLPLAVVDVNAEQASLSTAAETLERVIVADLERAGRIRATPAPEGALNGAFATPNVALLVESGARRALAIDISNRLDGRVTIAARAFDVATGSSDGMQYVSTPDNLRRIGHRIADRLNSLDGGGADLDSRLLGVRQHDAGARIVIMDSDGANFFFVTSVGEFSHPRFGPGANFFYIARETNGSRVMAMNLETNRREAITGVFVAAESGLAAARGAPVIAYVRQDGAEADIEVLRTSDGAILHRWQLDGWQGEPALDQHGTQIAFLSGEEGARQILIASADGATLPVTLGLPGDYRHLSLSPDGAWLAVVSRVNGAHQVGVIPVTGVDPFRVLATSEHFDRPSWSPSGSLLFVSGADGAASINVTSDARARIRLPFDMEDFDWSGLLP